MKELLIVSTYGIDAVRDWYTIQKLFLDKYASFADLGVYLHEVKYRKPFDNYQIIGRTEGDLLYKLPQMFHQIYQYCKDKKYKNYLILDSDAFPVKKDWYEKLLEMMGNRWYASPVRTENLDVSPHPCALFVRGEYIKEYMFQFHREVRPVYNLMGERVFDIGAGFKTEHHYPLLRSNFINLHPILGAIYGDTFYHHGAGSRPPYFRATEYWNQVSHHYKSGFGCYSWISKRPEEYIATMRGVGVIENKKTLRDFFEGDK